MYGFLQKVKENKFIILLKNLLSNKFFPLIFIPISLLCYYLGLDMVMIYVIGIFATLIFLLLEDISPIVSIFLFMAIFVSDSNTTSIWVGSTADFYFQTGNLIQIFILIAIAVASAIYRVIKNIIKKEFKFSPIFWSLCAFAVALILNGILSKDYIVKNLLYGFMMALSFLGIFTILKDNIMLDRDSFVKIAYGFLAFGIVLTIELIVKYCTTENIMNSGTINRDLITFGWGTWNTIGMYFVLCIPFIVYLAGKEKFGFIFAIASVLIFVASIMSCSRQSIIGALIVYPASLLLLFIKGKNRLRNVAITVSTIAVLLIILLLINDKLFEYFKILFEQIVVNGELSGNGRMRIWGEALAHFKAAPIFGSGFYVEMTATHLSGLSFLPIMAHNTIMQLLSSCGIIGLIIYLSHRVLTCISYFRHVTVERTYLMFAIVTFLIVCLFDNHIFNIFPTIIYSSLIAMLTSSEKNFSKAES